MNYVRVNFSSRNGKIIGGLIILCLLFSALQTYAQPLAAGKDRFLGGGTSSYIWRYIGDYWNQVTPGNDGKWGVVENVKGQYNWTNLDKIYTFATNRNLIFKEHALVWGQQAPSWIGSLDSASQRTSIENWFKAFGERYPLTALADVVNEPFHAVPSYAKGLGGSGATGWDWVITAFQLARKYMPATCKLILNEYNVLHDNAVTTNYLNLIKLLSDRNLIDAIGIQGHYFEFRSHIDATSNNYVWPVATIKSNLDRLGATGIPVYITEFDIDEASDANQLASYQIYFPIFWKHPAVKGITLWGYIDSDVWNQHPTTYLLIENGGVERPALKWLRSYIATTDLEEVESTLPVEFTVSQNYPNPFNPETTIRYQLPTAATVSLKVYDIMGREVATLVNEYKQPGSYKVQFANSNSKSGEAGSHLSSGVYFYTIIAGNFNQTKKMILIK